MASTKYSVNHSLLKKAVRSALESALLSVLASVLMHWRLKDVLAREAFIGLFAAWSASTISVWAILFFRHRSFKAFMWAFGGGVFLRGGLLAGLMWSVWGDPHELQAARLVAYAGGILALLCTEYRHLNRI